MDFEEYKENYFRRWQKRIYRYCVSLFFAIIILTTAVNIALYIDREFSIHDFFFHTIVRVLIPSALQAIIIFPLPAILKKKNISTFVTNKFMAYGFFWLLSIMSIFHSKYSLFMVIPFLAMLFAAMFTDKKLLKGIFIACWIELFISMASWVIFYSNHPVSYEILTATALSVVLLLVYFISKEILRSQNAQINFISFNYKKVLELSKELQLEPLTRLFNRRALAETIEKLLKVLSESDEEKASLVFFDLDNFKNVNDTYGHAAGDAILISLSESIIKTMNTNRNAFRYGGDEFVLLLRNKTREEIVSIVEKIMDDFRKLSFDYLSDDARCTMSVGISDYKKGWNSKDWFKSADEAAYKAKLNGKDRYEIAE